MRDVRDRQGRVRAVWGRVARVYREAPGVHGAAAGRGGLLPLVPGVSAGAVGDFITGTGKDEAREDERTWSVK